MATWKLDLHGAGIARVLLLERYMLLAQASRRLHSRVTDALVARLCCPAVILIPLS